MNSTSPQGKVNESQKGLIKDCSQETFNKHLDEFISELSDQICKKVIKVGLPCLTNVVINSKQNSGPQLHYCTVFDTPYVV